MSDLVVELRKVACGSVFPGKITGTQKKYLDGLREIMDAAAEEIERLRRVEKERNEAIELLHQAMDGNSDLHIDIYTKIDSYIANLED